MAALRHPRWGLKQYISLRDYHMGTADQIIELTPSIWAQAQRAINAVIKVAEAHTQVDIDKMASSVTLEMLYQILNLMHSMEGIYRLAKYPLIITGCIKLLSTIQPTPFSYEFGYLCFNILEITLGICFIERSQGLFNMKMTSDMGLLSTAPVGELSEHIDSAVEEEIDYMLEEHKPEYTDWTLGWADFPGQATKTPLVSLSDARSLLFHLWEDRLSFFALVGCTFCPGITVVVHLLWRYVRHECIVNKRSFSKLLIRPFAELLWRFILGAVESQQKTLCFYILESIDEIPGVWTVGYTPINPADSLMILTKYCKILESSNPDFPQHISISAMPALLDFVTPMVTPGAGVNDAKMFPDFFRASLRRLWEAAVREEGMQKREHFINCAYAVFCSFG
ncbi:unnamed protein product [Rhizoctonia solani]|uniref:Uncharacterized protein n=1 Tax=Rhizoctonia solani TaxID=456999 RepID=A0A8H3C4V8_9AGAM|nr:unnamed protein product [Rhizoctonia solani]